MGAPCAQVEVPDAPEHILVVEWVNGPHRAKLVADFAASDFHTEVTQTDASQPHRMSMQQYRRGTLSTAAPWMLPGTLQAAGTLQSRR